MLNTFGSAAIVFALVIGTAQFARAESQRGPSPFASSNASTTVFHGTSGDGVTGGPGYGGGRAPAYATSSGGTTVFHGTPAGPPTPWPAPPPWLPPPPASGAGR